MTRGEAVNWIQKFKSLFHLLLDASRKFDSDHCFLLSSGIAFPVIICLIPLLLLALALIGTYLFGDQKVLDLINKNLKDAFPSLDPHLRGNILHIIRHRQVFGILGIAGLIWTSTWVFSSLRTALNMIFTVKNEHTIIHGKMIDLLMILLAEVLLLISMALTSAITLAWNYSFKLPLDLGPVFQFALRYLIPFFFTFSMFFLIYKVAPIKEIPNRIALKTAFGTGLLWDITKHLFGWYVFHLGRFSMIYGSLGALAVFFFWIYYSAAILLLGGEIAFLLEQRAEKVNR